MSSEITNSKLLQNDLLNWFYRIISLGPSNKFVFFSFAVAFNLIWCFKNLCSFELCKPSNSIGPFRVEELKKKEKKTHTKIHNLSQATLDCKISTKRIWIFEKYARGYLWNEEKKKSKIQTIEKNVQMLQIFAFLFHCSRN